MILPYILLFLRNRQIIFCLSIHLKLSGFKTEECSEQPISLFLTMKKNYFMQSTFAYLFIDISINMQCDKQFFLNLSSGIHQIAYFSYNMPVFWRNHK
jgi:hypothetical protein